MRRWGMWRGMHCSVARAAANADGNGDRAGKWDVAGARRGWMMTAPWIGNRG